MHALNNEILIMYLTIQLKHLLTTFYINQVCKSKTYVTHDMIIGYISK